MGGQEKKGRWRVDGQEKLEVANGWTRKARHPTLNFGTIPRKEMIAAAMSFPQERSAFLDSTGCQAVAAICTGSGSGILRGGLSQWLLGPGAASADCFFLPSTGRSGRAGWKDNPCREFLDMRGNLGFYSA